MVFRSVGTQTPLNKVKASGGCHRFSEEMYRAELDTFWAQIRQGAFDHFPNDSAYQKRGDIELYTLTVGSIVGIPKRKRSDYYDCFS
ncbi:hypothetical protein J6TS1_13280 [Siminovitchia terrae]|uniref:Uncharacterized protein n=1 Tax=Siminovitchia terrae TaxID=1914933 RepID=A0ABQ4KTU7_SIMTE|nr:hypothetical protein [Siminovitchia terrae]GIN95458.1 hypothetical protein J6TS1_13280 [Siminovitchia terrae]